MPAIAVMVHLNLKLACWAPLPLGDQDFFPFAVSLNAERSFYNDVSYPTPQWAQEMTSLPPGNCVAKDIITEVPWGDDNIWRDSEIMI